MAGTTGLEPATSAVTGQRSNQLSYVPLCIFNAVQSGKSTNLFAQASRLQTTKTVTVPSFNCSKDSLCNRLRQIVFRAGK